VSSENLSMAVSRYAFAASLADGADVLEVGCGQGQGLGWLRRRARRVIGGDLTPGLLAGARRHYGGRVPLVGLDAGALPFRSGSFDVVLLLEAVYYLPDVDAFVRECRRVLRPQGRVLVCSTNPARPGFHPSPFSTGYLTAPDVAARLARGGFDVSLSAAFPRGSGAAGDAAMVLIAVALGLVPRTLAGRARLKRLLVGRLVTVPLELDESFAPVAPPLPISSTDDAARFKVFYALGRRQTP
jgi:SAM-dependent methyltransferase